MRMSDWSSDVCSSDLAKPRGSRACRGRRRHRAARPIALSGPPSPGKHCGERKNRPICHGDRSGVGALEMTEEGATMTAITTPSIGRSEEHTSELQSLMRISYAVFCLKKKQKIKNQDHSYKK